MLRKTRNRAAEWPLHLMLLPSVALLLLYSYGPMIGAVMAFQRFIPAKGWLGSEWVGFDNFTFVMRLPNFADVLGNTVSISLMKMAAGLIAPLVTAILLNEIRRAVFKRTVQTIVYLPHFLSWVILGGILIDLLSVNDGIVNRLLEGMGMERIPFLIRSDWFPLVIVVSDVWKEFGFATIVYLAAITGINPSLYEAAVMDGAGHLKQIRHVTLPGMAPIIILLAVLSLGNILNAGFEQIFILYSPAVYETGDIIDTFVYRTGLSQGQYSLAAAVGIFKSAISLLLISLSYYLAYRLANYRIF